MDAELGLAWLHEHALDDRTVTAAYAGSPETPFTIEGQQARRDGALAGVGISYRDGGFAARLAYRGEFRGGFSATGVFGGVQFVF